MNFVRVGWVTAAAVVALAAPRTANANVSSDQVLSQHIRDADGTSGQDTGIGSGVKSGHIQDGAVTTPKIAPGAVTDAQISGPISASKISSAGLNADTVDGVDSSSLARRHVNVVVVSKDGLGDYPDPASAMNAIADASAANPYLIKVMPGDYDLGLHGQIWMKPYVDIEGSGRGVTRVFATNDGWSPGGVIVMTNAVPNEVRDITVESRASGYYTQTYTWDGIVVNVSSGGAGYLSRVRLVSTDAIYGAGIYAYNSSTFTVNDAEIVVRETEDLSARVGASTHQWGVYVDGDANGTLDRVQVRVSGGDSSIGIYYLWGSGLSLSNSDFEGGQYGAHVGYESGDARLAANSVKIRGGRVHGNTCGLRLNVPSVPAAVLARGVEVDGPLCLTSGTRMRLVQSVDGAFAPIPDVAP